MNRFPPPLLPDEAVDCDLQQRLGRNLVVFQRIEANLKRLMSTNRLEFRIPVGVDPSSIDPDTIMAKNQRRAKDRCEQTLGPLKNAYLAEILGMSPAEDSLPADDGAFHLRLDVAINLPEAEKNVFARSLEILVKDRNEMTHLLLQRLGKGEPDKLTATKAWLDEVHERAIEFLATLRQQMFELAEARTSLVELIQTDEFKQRFEAEINPEHSPSCSPDTTSLPRRKTPAPG